jgi:hypothetical protein
VKSGKKETVEKPIPNKYEFRLLIVVYHHINNPNLDPRGFHGQQTNKKLSDEKRLCNIASAKKSKTSNTN